MAYFYFDTSALLKRYRREPGTDALNHLLATTTAQSGFSLCYTSYLTVLESTSSLLRLVKGGQMEEDKATEMLARFHSDINQWLTVWPVDDALLRESLLVVQRHRLKAADAIHLATALGISLATPGENMVVVASDAQLAAAAGVSGLEAFNPESRSWRARLNRLGLPS